MQRDGRRRQQPDTGFRPRQREHRHGQRKRPGHEPFGQPEQRGTSTANRDGTTAIGVSESTSTAVGTMSQAGAAGNQTLRVTSVRVLADTCQ